MKNGRHSRILRPLLSVLFWIVLWQGLALILGKPLLLPAPLEVIRRLAELIVTAEFWRYTSMSLSRVLGGVLSAMVLGVLLAVISCKSRMLDALFTPLMTIIKSSPVASFVILVLIWIPRSYVPILISSLMVLPVIWSNVSAGIRQTDRQLLELAEVYQLSGIKTIKRIYIPSVLPHFRSACRAALGMGWKAGIAAEILTMPRESIGRMIYESKLYLQTTDLFAWTLLVIVLSLALEKLVFFLLDRSAEK